MKPQTSAIITHIELDQEYLWLGWQGHHYYPTTWIWFSPTPNKIRTNPKTMWGMTAMRWHSPQIGHCLRTLVTHWSDVTLRWDLLNIDPEYPLRLHSFMEIVPNNLQSIKHISPMLTQSLKLLSRQKSPEVPCLLPKDSRKGCLFLKIGLQFSKIFKLVPGVADCGQSWCILVCLEGGAVCC